MAKLFGDADAAPMSTPDLARLSRCFRSVSLKAGTVLFPEGTIPKGVWVLQYGSVELVTRLGGRPAVIRILRSGESVGDIQLLSGRPSRYKARVAEPCIALFATAGDLQRLLIEAPSVARRWISKLNFQIDKNHDRIVALLGGSLEEKVARCLTDESRDHEFPFSQGTLAALLGVHRSSVNPVLKVFEARGLIALGYRRITVLAPRHLSRIARGWELEAFERPVKPARPAAQGRTSPSIMESEVWQSPGLADAPLSDAGPSGEPPRGQAGSA